MGLPVDESALVLPSPFLEPPNQPPKPHPFLVLAAAAARLAVEGHRCQLCKKIRVRVTP